MQKFLLSGLCMLFLLVSVTNCSQPSCKTDSECSNGLTCQQGQCRPPCKSDGDCLGGQSCVQGTCQQPSADAGKEPQKTPEPIPEKVAEVTPEPDAKPDTAPPDRRQPPAKCEFVAEAPRAFATSDKEPKHRHDIVTDFTLLTQDGRRWNFKEKWTGCDTYIFIPDTIPVSQLAPRSSVWAKDLDQLLARSPKNVHYFFVGRSEGAGKGIPQKEMQARIDKHLATLSPTLREHWKSRLHVISRPSYQLSGWIGKVSNLGIGVSGFAIDRFQKLRGVGSLADVRRYKSALQAAKAWPFEANMAYAANEAIYYNFEAKRQARLDKETIVEVKLWKGEVIKEFADMEVTLPSADEMKKFDTLELDVTQQCPNKDKGEFSNCGAWDYLAHFYLLDKDNKKLELARHITTYHREGRWIMDITPMLVRLKNGGKMKFRWLWAPKWNKQPTATWLSLRFSNRNKGIRPTALFPLFTGGKFDENYNSTRKPLTVSVPAGAKKVKLWAVISGHGNSSVKCAEFCNHQHQFTINGKAHLQEYKHVGDSEDCMKKVSQGVVPNQWGTWWLGRGGWCPGQQVKPYVVDVTSDVPGGKDATISYKGLFQGKEPPKQSKVGNINLQSYLVVYE